MQFDIAWIFFPQHQIRCLFWAVLTVFLPSTLVKISGNNRGEVATKLSKYGSCNKEVKGGSHNKDVSHDHSVAISAPKPKPLCPVLARVTSCSWSCSSSSSSSCFLLQDCPHFPALPVQPRVTSPAPPSLTYTTIQYTFRSKYSWPTSQEFKRYRCYSFILRTFYSLQNAIYSVAKPD